MQLVAREGSQATKRSRGQPALKSLIAKVLLPPQASSRVDVIQAREIFHHAIAEANIIPLLSTTYSPLLGFDSGLLFALLLVSELPRQGSRFYVIPSVYALC